MFINEKNIKKYYELNKLSRVVAAMLQNILKLEEIPKYLFHSFYKLLLIRAQSTTKLSQKKTKTKKNIC
jgi:hypothetical protein